MSLVCRLLSTTRSAATTTTTRITLPIRLAATKMAAATGSSGAPFFAFSTSASRGNGHMARGVDPASSNPHLKAKRNLIAVCQLTSRENMEENFTKVEAMVRRAAAEHPHCRMVFLPECFDYIATSKENTIAAAIEENGPYIEKYRQLARETGVWLSLGGFHHLPANTPQGTRPFNTHLVIDSSGNTSGSYQKLHLFNLEIPSKGVRLLESEFSVQGEHLVPPVLTPAGALGLGICYDVRFAELALWNRCAGAQLLAYPSSFTVPTGSAHWEALLRARAIETQCYVVAAAQTGKHNDKRSSYGHSLIVDPWGAVVAQCSDREDMCFAEIDLDYVEEVRQLLPVAEHRRADLYQLKFHPPPPTPSQPKSTTPTAGGSGDECMKNDVNANNSDFDFGGHPIPPSCIFAESQLSVAFVNLKPLVPGHVLCCSRRLAKRLLDLNDEETADMFNLAKRVQKMVESQHGAPASTLACQDGKEAGRTVAHVHVHILPRHRGDMGSGGNDSIFSKLQGHEELREPRTMPEMVEEATRYRKAMEPYL